MKNIVVLGSTGSIGTQTLDVVRHMPEQLHISVLAAGGGRPQLLAEQIKEFKPEMVVVFEPAGLEAVQEILKNEKLPAIQWRSGMESRKGDPLSTTTIENASESQLDAVCNILDNL